MEYIDENNHAAAMMKVRLNLNSNSAMFKLLVRYEG